MEEQCAEREKRGNAAKNLTSLHRHRSYGSLRRAVLTFSQNFKNTSSPPPSLYLSGLEAVRLALKPHSNLTQTSPPIKDYTKTTVVENQ